MFSSLLNGLPKSLAVPLNYARKRGRKPACSFLMKARG